MSISSLGHFPSKDKWEFDDAVTNVFDDMLERSIPQYKIMRKAVLDLSTQFIREDTDVVDLGCSRGESIAPLVQQFMEKNHFIGCEISDSMLNASRERFAKEIELGIVDIRKMDLRSEYPETKNVSITTAVFTLQFTPIEYRQDIIQRIHDSTVKGGVFILVEKLLGQSAFIDGAMKSIYYDLKGKNGYSRDEIEIKRLSLEGILVPVTAKWNEELLQNAGFRYIDCFWRWMNFAGWVAIK